MYSFSRFPPSASGYAELHCLTNFSFQRGASHPEELVIRAAELGYDAIAITDECSFAGVVRAHQEIRRLSLPLKLIIGSEIRLADGPRVALLATDRDAYGRLARLISVGRRAAEKGEYRLTRADLDRGVPGCLALLVPPDDGPLDAAALVADARWLGERFPDRAWLAVALACGPNDAARLAQLQSIAVEAGLQPVAATGVLMHDVARRPLADVLTATRLHLTVAESGRALAPNSERCLHAREALAARYPPALLAETLVIAAQCCFQLDELRYEYPAELVPDGETPATWLRRLVEDGLRWRYGQAQGDPATPRVRTQVEHELALIAELGFEAYFLTVHDIVRFARSQGILCQGRGSAANSIVCWALGITEVDPELGIMLVERFISKERNEPPDIDVDFEHERREEVIQYVYRKYGRERAALAATVIRYRARSALRDVGRALGFPPGQIERLTRDHFWFDGRHILPDRLREAGLDPASPTVQRLAALTEELVGFPRHLSQHVGGFVIARGRLDELVPVENAAMPERTVIQWDKDDLDTLGLLKIDVLALGMLSALRRSLAMVSAWRGRPLTLADIPREDARVYRMLSNADSVGVFQIESRAQMTMLPRLKPARFYDLVVQVAIVRPGPIQGGMVHPYLEARARIARKEQIEYPQPEFRRAAPGAIDAVDVADVADASDDTRVSNSARASEAVGATVELAEISGVADKAAGVATAPTVVEAGAAVATTAVPRDLPEAENRSRSHKGDGSPRAPVVAAASAPAASDAGDESAKKSDAAGVRQVLERTLGVPIFQEQVMQLAVVAAGFSPGEADQLRRAMGAFRRHGELERYRAQLLTGMTARGYRAEFAEQLCNQIEGFGSYGFPESHAASFALLVYFSAWLKCFEPAAFLCGLLNSQPMGFYSPSPLIQDARRHAVTIRAADVTASEWDCTLEGVRDLEVDCTGETDCMRKTDSILETDLSRETGCIRKADCSLRTDGALETEGTSEADHSTDTPLDANLPRSVRVCGNASHGNGDKPGSTALSNPSARLGLRMVKGFNREAAERIVAARAERPFVSVDDLARRAGLDAAELKLLANAGALERIAGHRRQALWQAAGGQPAHGVLREAPIAETAAKLEAPTEAQELLADYAKLGFTLGRHPLALLRARLAAMRFVTAAEVAACADRQLARIAGIVTCRQRPGTAKGTMFVTVEDETGLANVIVRPELIERQRREVLGARLLGVFGQISRQGKVVHLLANRVVDHSALLGTLDARSRNFH
jgi:DNA polymerase III alpha subunit